MATASCPGCGQRVEAGPGQPARCPHCGERVPPGQEPVEAELVSDDEGVTVKPRPGRERRPARDRDWDEEDDRRPPRPQVRRGKRGGSRFLNATTIGAVLGFLGPASVVALVAVASGGTKPDEVPFALLGALCVGIVGCAIGVVIGWVIDALIYATRAAPADEGPSRRGSRGRRRSRWEDDEE